MPVSPQCPWPLLSRLHPCWNCWVISEGFFLALWYGHDANSHSLHLPNRLFTNVCGLALWSAYRYFNFLLTCSVEDLISSFIFFSQAACGQVFLSDHLVAIHLYGGLRKELISLVSLAVSASFDSKLPLSPLKILMMLVLQVPVGIP